MTRPAPASRAAATICSPTPPQPITHTRLAQRDARRVAHGADPGHHPAPEQRRLPQRQPGRDRHGARGRDDAALGEAGDEVEVLDRRPVGEPQPRACRRAACPAHACAARRLAEVEAPGRAGAARAARRDEAERDAVAGRDAVDAVADRLDHARALVPEHHRPAPGARARRRRGAGRSGRRPRRRRGRAPRPRAGGSSDTSSHRQRPAGLVQDGGARLHHATRCASSASRSGSTPSPGPCGGAIVPSAAISSGAGSSQSRRAGRPGRRVERHLDVRARRDGERDVQVGEQARARSTRCAARTRARRGRPARRSGGSRRARRRARRRAGSRRRRRAARGRAPRTAPRTISPAAIRSDVRRRSAA